MSFRLSTTLILSCAALAFVACGDDKNPSNAACENGICGTAATNGNQGGDGASGSGAGTSGAGTSGAGNGGGGDSGGGSGSGGTAGTSGGSGGSGGSSGSGGPTCATGASCQESWLCSAWETATAPSGTLPTGDNAGTRTCVDQCNCGTTTNKPSETMTLPALSFDFYQCEVEPILDKYCAQLGCHGTETGRALRTYARGKRRITGETWSFPAGSPSGCPANTSFASEDCNGSFECECYELPHSKTEWQRNFDSARAFAKDAQGNAFGNIEDSELLKQPLLLKDGGLAHAGIHIFDKTGPDYATLKSWLDGSGTACTHTAQKTN